MALTDAEIATLNERLALYYTAEAAILRNQSYEMPDGRKLARTDLKSVQAEIRRIKDELAGGTTAPRVRGRARRGSIMSN